MKEYNVNDELKRWVDKSLRANAPIGQTGLKYPYKPFLMLSILYLYKENAFNRKIKLDDVTKPFYDYLTSDETVWSLLKEQTSKIDWDINKWDKRLSKQVLNTICKMPAQMLLKDWDTFYQFDQKEKTIYLNYHGDTREALEFIESACIELLAKILPNTMYSISDVQSNIYEILDTERFYNRIIEEIAKAADSGKIKRDSSLQHIYAKKVKERDGVVCQICDTNYGIEAAHLYHFKNLKTDLVKAYDPNNGIALCRTCHGIHNDDLLAFKDGKLKYCEHLQKDHFIANSFNWHDPKSMSPAQIEYANKHFDDSYKCKKEATQ